MGEKTVAGSRYFRVWLAGSLVMALLLIVLSACVLPTAQPIKAPRLPLALTKVSVSPDPVVGQIVTLHVEIVSERDQPDGVITIQLPESVRWEKGDLIWHGSLVANQSLAHEVSICVLYPGDWRLFIVAGARLAPNSGYSDADTLDLVSTVNSGKAIRGNDYRYTQPTIGPPRPTAPPPTPAGGC